MNTWLSGGGVAPVLASPATGDVVIAGFGPNNDEPTTTATIGGEDMTLLHFDDTAGWAFFKRVLTGAEADGSCVFETNGSGVTSAYGFAQQWTDCGDVEFDSFDGSVNLYGGLALPQTFEVEVTDASLAADAVALFMAVLAADGGGSITIGTPTSFTSRGSQQESSGSDRAKGQLFSRAGAATLDDPTQSSVSKSLAGNVTSFSDWAFVLQVLFTDDLGWDAVEGQNPAQDNVNYYHPYERRKVKIKALPYELGLGILGDWDQ